MKLLVVNGLSALRGGGQTYLINFLEHLPDGNYKVLLLVNSKNIDVFKKYTSDNIEIYEAKWASRSIVHRSLWERFVLPSFLKEREANVYYAPGGVMITKMPEGLKSATALRNMLPFDERERKRFPLMSYLRFKLWTLHYTFLKSYKMSDKVVFISEYSKSVIEELIPDIGHKSVVIPHGLNSQFLNAKQADELPNNLKNNKFYLYVSILDVYKAQKEIIKAWKILSDNGFDYPLVLAGPKYNSYGEEVEAMITKLGLQDKVVYLGKVDYDELPGFYKSARALIFASSCECCPNILLEKLAARKPVICSDIEPMPEFAKQAALYFNPYDSRSLVTQVLALENGSELRERLGRQAYQEALKYDWSRTVEKTIDFLLKTQQKHEVYDV